MMQKEVFSLSFKQNKHQNNQNMRQEKHKEQNVSSNYNQTQHLEFKIFKFYIS